MQAKSTLLGRRVIFQTSHSDGSLITFSAKIVKVKSPEMVWVEMPQRVRSLPFPPLDGKRYGLYRIADLTFKD